MPAMDFGETRLSAEGLDAHFPHEGSYMDSVYCIASHSEHVFHASRTKAGHFKVNLIDQTHELSVLVAYQGQAHNRRLTGRVVTCDTASLPSMDVP